MDKIIIGTTFFAGFMGSFIGAACGWIVFAPADKPLVISYDSELTSNTQPSRSNMCSTIIDNHTNIVPGSDKKDD